MGMTPFLNYPDTDGIRYSRTSVEVSVVATGPQIAGQTTPPAIAAPLRIQGWTGLSYTRKLTPGKGWSHRSKPQTRTNGKFEPSAEFSMYIEDSRLLEIYLANAGLPFGKGAFQQTFQLTATVFEPSLGTTRLDMIGARIEQDAVSIETGSDEELECKYTLNVMDIMLDFISVVYENTPQGQVGVIVTV